MLETGITEPTIAEEINNFLIKKRIGDIHAECQRLIGNVLEDGSYKFAIKIFSTCIHCPRTIPMIGHDKHKPRLPDTNSEDRVYYALAYGCMSHPFVPVRKKENYGERDYAKK